MNIRQKLTAMGLAGALALSGGYVAVFEGKENKAYVDPVGIYTICYGETSGVKKGMYKTDDECLESLANELVKHNEQMMKYVQVPLNTHQQAAFLSFIYNVGVGNFRKSTLLRKLNNGDYTGACNELPKWKYAGGQELAGLVSRRDTERKLCLGELVY